MSISENFLRDIERYLENKLPGLNEATAMEISAYVNHRALIFVNEAYSENERRIKDRYHNMRRYNEKPKGDATCPE